MKDATHLVRRGTVYYFRARVPAALQHAYGGKTAVVVSLHTKDRAEAKVRVLERSAELQREYQRALAASPLPLSPGKRLYLSEQDIDRICAGHREQILRGDHRDRIRGVSEDSAEVSGDLYESWLSTIKAALARGKTAIIEDALSDALRALGVDVARGSDSYTLLAYRFLAAEVTAYEDVMRRQRGEYVETPAPRKPRSTLDDIVAYWAQQTEPRPATQADFQHVFRNFRSLHPTLAAEDVRKTHVIEYRDHLAAQGRAPKTVQRHLNHLHAAFQIAADSERVAFNPVTGVRPTQSKKRKEKSRLPFTNDELNKIFYSKVFTKQVRPKGGGGEAAYWLPLLALWTGARLEELAQLEPSDVREEREQGFYLDINDEGDEKRLKNRASLRRVPLHKELERLGFVEYVRSQKRSKKRYLFPDLRPDVKGNRSGNFSKWWARYLTFLGVTDSRKVFHSFRHGFVDACREVMNPELRDAIVGHANRSIAEQYGTGRYPLPPLFEAVNRVNYRGLSLAPLRKGRKG